MRKLLQALRHSLLEVTKDELEERRFLQVERKNP
jgi:hypothetical protein